MWPQSKLTIDVLIVIKNKLEAMLDIVNSVIEGTGSFTSECNKHGIAMPTFRKMLSSVLDMRCDSEPVEFVDIPASSFDPIPIEEVYALAFCIALPEDYTELKKYMPDDPDKAFCSISGIFSKRDLDIFTAYIWDKVTMEEIGKQYGVTRERIAQIFKRSVRKLRNPSVRKILGEGSEWMLETSGKRILRAKELELEALERDIAEIDKLIKSRKQCLDEKLDSATDIYPDAKEKMSAMNIPIIELNLSVRSYNCLNRARILTVSDICDIKSVDELIKIRNLGRKSVEEIINKMRELGLDETICPILK